VIECADETPPRQPAGRRRYTKLEAPDFTFRRLFDFVLDLLRAEVLDVDVRPQPRVVGEIPAVMVGIFVDHDLVAVPEPVTAQGKVKGGDAESEAAKPETGRTASANAPYMAAAEAAGESAMLKRMIDVEAGIIASGVVADPGAVVVNVRSFGMAFPIAAGGGSGRRAAHRRGTMFGNVSATDGVAATSAVVTVLRQGRDGKDHSYSQN